MKASTGEFYAQAREILAALGNRSPSQDEVITVATGLRNAHNSGALREHHIAGPCAWCNSPSDSGRAIHRDGPGEGPLVPLCERCASGRFPEAREIWAKLAMGSDR